MTIQFYNKSLLLALWVGISILLVVSGIGCNQSAPTKQATGDTQVQLTAEEQAKNDALRGAVADGDIAVVKNLVSEGADVNAKYKGGWTPLHFAAFDGYIEVVKFLVSKGADVNVKNDGDKTPLDLAKQYERSEVVEYLESLK